MAVVLVSAVTIFVLNHGPDRTLPPVQGKPVQVVVVQNGDLFDPSAPTDFLLAENREAAVPSVDQLSREIQALLNP
jgi:hypothetical protein